MKIDISKEKNKYCSVGFKRENGNKIEIKFNDKTIIMNSHQFNQFKGMFDYWIKKPVNKKRINYKGYKESVIVKNEKEKTN